MYISFDPRVPGEAEKALSVLTKCIDEVSGWMVQNMLCLNNDKTEFIIVANPRVLNCLSDISLRVGDTIINSRHHVRNLGVEFNSSLSMSHHISTLCRSLNFHLRNLSRVRMFIDDVTCYHAVRALVTSRLDYSNSLLYGTSKKEINRLQRLQNRAAKLILMRLNIIMPLLIFRNCIGFLSWNELNSRFWFSFLNILPVVLPHTLRILFLGIGPAGVGFVRAWIPEFFPNQELILSPQIKVFMLPPLHSGTIFLTISVMLLH